MLYYTLFSPLRKEVDCDTIIEIIVEYYVYNARSQLSAGGSRSGTAFAAHKGALF